MKARASFVNPALTLSVRRQFELLTVTRGRLYYAPKEERPENLEIMRIMDKHLIDHPTEGVLSMVELLKDYQFHVNPKWIRRLFRLMGYHRRSIRVKTCRSWAWHNTSSPTCCVD